MLVRLHVPRRHGGRCSSCVHPKNGRERTASISQIKRGRRTPPSNPRGERTGPWGWLRRSPLHRRDTGLRSATPAPSGTCPENTSDAHWKCHSNGPAVNAPETSTLRADRCPLGGLRPGALTVKQIRTPVLGARSGKLIVKFGLPRSPPPPLPARTAIKTPKTTETMPPVVLALLWRALRKHKQQLC